MFSEKSFVRDGDCTFQDRRNDHTITRDDCKRIVSLWHPQREKLFSCEDCGKKFGYSKNLLRHKKKTCRPSEKMAEKHVSNATPSNVTVRKRSFRKSCRFCNKEIVRKANLLLHERNCEQHTSGPAEKRQRAVLYPNPAPEWTDEAVTNDIRTFIHSHLARSAFSELSAGTLTECNEDPRPEN